MLEIKKNHNNAIKRPRVQKGVLSEILNIVYLVNTVWSQQMKVYCFI
jgi:hypothetical protein